MRHPFSALVMKLAILIFELGKNLVDWLLQF
jgi:hypothetical protein